MAVDARIGGGDFNFISEIGLSGTLPILLELPLDTGIKKNHEARSAVKQVLSSRKYKTPFLRTSYHELNRTLIGLDRRHKHMIQGMSPSLNMTYSSGFLGQGRHGPVSQRERSFEIAISKLDNLQTFHANESGLAGLNFQQHLEETNYGAYSLTKINSDLQTIGRDNIEAKISICQDLQRGQLSPSLFWFFETTNILKTISKRNILGDQKLMVTNTDSLLSSDFLYRVNGSSNTLEILLFVRTIKTPTYNLYHYQDIVPILPPNQSNDVYYFEDVQYIALMANDDFNNAISISTSHLMDSCSAAGNVYLCKTMPRSEPSCAHGIWTENINETLEHCKYQQSLLKDTLKKIDGDSFVVTSTNSTIGHLNCGMSPMFSQLSSP